MAGHTRFAVVARQFAGLPLRDFVAKTLVVLLCRAGLRVRVFRLMVRPAGPEVAGPDARPDAAGSPATAAPPLPAGFAGRFLDEAAALALADVADSGLRAGFVRTAYAHGDACYAIFDGAEPASYGWYATGGRTAMPDGLAARFDPAWVYLYHTWTRPAWRGRRLHETGARAALAHYAAAGRRGLVTVVEVTNYESLRAMRRLGCTVAGSAWVGWRAGRPRVGHRVVAGRCPLRLAAAPDAGPDAAPDPGPDSAAAPGR